MHLNYANLHQDYLNKNVQLKDVITEVKNQNNLMELKIHEIEKNETINNSENEELEKEIDKLQSILDCLKIKGYFTNKCF